MRYVVDTNVPIVANGNNTDASPKCRLATIDFLEQMMAKGRLMLDLEGEIESEYTRNLKYGQPGVGYRFIQAFLTTASSRVERYPLSKNGAGDFDAFPVDRALRKFDKSDRKFVALSVVSKAPIANATDSDWLECHEALKKAKVKVDFLCGVDMRNWKE